MAAARSGLFDTIGHLDFVKRYLHPYVLPAQLAERAGAVRADPRGARRERHGPRGEHERPAPGGPARRIPRRPIVARFRELGGERVTVGSDAHRAKHFAWALGDGYEVARSAGFERLAVRDGIRALPPR